MIKIFIDSSVIIAALISKTGASREVLIFRESSFFEGWISTKVIDEVTKVIERKSLILENDLKEILNVANLKVVKKLDPFLLLETSKWIKDKNDAHILAAAKQADVDIILTLDIRHFIKDLEVSKKSGLKIMTPGEFIKGFIKIQ